MRVLAYPFVVDLMYPSRTRALLSVLKTDPESEDATDHRDEPMPVWRAVRSVTL
jgi:hypothetical protein